MSNFATDVFGSTPDVAPYIKTIFSDEQLKALEENLAAMPDISALGSDYYNYMLGLMNQAIPGFSNILSAGGALTQQEQGIAKQELAGQIPQDVQDQLYRSSAFQSLASGISGSPMAKGLTARDFGLTSLDMQQRGMSMEAAAGNAAQRWAGLASGLIMNPASFFVTPQQQAALTMQNNLYKQATQQLRYNLAAAPDPVAAGVSNTIMNVIGAYIGHGGLGAGGGAGGGGGPSGGSVSGGAGGAGGMDLYNPNYNYGTGAGGAVTPDASGVNVSAPGGGGNWFSRLMGGGGGGGGGGPGSGAGTSSLGVAETTAFPTTTGLSIPGSINVPGWSTPDAGQQIALNPNAFSGGFDPTAASDPFGMSTDPLSQLLSAVNPSDYTGMGGSSWDLSNLFASGQPTGTTDFLGQNSFMGGSQPFDFNIQPGTASPMLALLGGGQ